MLKYKIYGYIAVAIFFIFFSCDSNYENEYYENHQIIPIDSLDVKLPNSYNDLNKWGYFYSNESIFLYEYYLTNNFDLTIHVLDFDKGSYQSPLRINREGPNGYKSTGVYVNMVNQDSIFIFPIPSEKFFLYNSKGQVLDEFPYNSLDGSIINSSGVYTDIVFQGDRVLIPTINNTRFDDNLFFKKVKPLHYYSFKKKKFEESISYPDYMIGKYLWSDLASSKINKIDDSLAVIDFRFSDSIRIYNSRTREQNYIFMGLNNDQLILNKVPSRSQEMSLLLTEKEYMYSVYYNHNIYRITSHLKSVKQKAIPLSDLMQNYSREITLIKYNLISKEYNYYKMPTTRYFLPIKEKLIVGGIISWEDENQDTWRRFYIYKLN